MEAVIHEGKNFRLVPEAELSGLLEFLSGHLPDALMFHHTLKTFLESPVWNFYFYVSKNWPDEPVALHFPSMTRTPNGRLNESFAVFCPLDRLDCLASRLRGEDVLLDWRRPLFLNFTHEAVLASVEPFYRDALGGTLERLVPGDLYVCDRLLVQDPNDLPSLQDGEVRELGAEHAEAVHEEYPGSGMESPKLFHALLAEAAVPTLGVHCAATGRLAAWALQSYFGGLFAVRTRPQFRRKGYGAHLVQRVTKLVLERGYTPFAIIRPDNDASIAVFRRLGFRRAHRTALAVLRPAASAGDDTCETSLSINLQPLC